MRFLILLICAIILASAQFENVTDFDSIDENKDNQISFVELKKWLETSGKKVGDALQIFQNYDSDSNNKLSISEFVPLAYKIAQRPTGVESDTIFQRFDLNKDGILTRKEIENSDKTLGSEIIEGLFLVADTNSDQRITYEEFKQISTAFDRRTEKHSQNIGIARSLLDTMDKNGDRRLSRQEIYVFVNQFNRVSERTVTTVFSQLDANNDHFISLSELRVLPQKITELAGFQQMPSI